MGEEHLPEFDFADSIIKELYVWIVNIYLICFWCKLNDKEKFY